MAASPNGGHAVTVSSAPARQPRPGWIRDVAVPRDLSDLRGPTVGVTRLPLRLYWSGPAPQQVEWDLSRQSRRARLYELRLAAADRRRPARRLAAPPSNVPLDPLQRRIATPTDLIDRRETDPPVASEAAVPQAARRAATTGRPGAD